MLVKIRGIWLDPEKVWGVGLGWVYEDGKKEATKGARIICDSGVQYDVLGTPDEVAAEINEAIRLAKLGFRKVDFHLEPIDEEEMKKKLLAANDQVMGRVFPVPDDVYLAGAIPTGDVTQLVLERRARQKLDDMVDQCMDLVNGAGLFSPRGIDVPVGAPLTMVVEKLIEKLIGNRKDCDRLNSLLYSARETIEAAGVVIGPQDGLILQIQKLIDRYALAPALTASENDRDRLHNMIGESMEKIVAAGVVLQPKDFESLPAAINKLIASRIPIVHSLPVACGSEEVPIATLTGIDGITCVACLRVLLKRANRERRVSLERAMNPASAEIADGFREAFAEPTIVEAPVEMAAWYEYDGRKTAPKVDNKLFGSHNYPYDGGTSDCSFGCGCWMGPARSGGKVDPFGPCPNNPLPIVAEKTVEPLCHGSEHFQAAGTDHCICGLLSLLEIKNYDTIQLKLPTPNVDVIEAMEKAARKVAAAVSTGRTANAMPSSWARKLAAGAWATPATSHKVMDPPLCDAFASILDSLKIAHLRQPAMALAKELKISLAVIDDPLAGTERLMLPITVVREFLGAVGSISGLELSESRQVPLPGCD